MMDLHRRVSSANAVWVGAGGQIFGGGRATLRGVDVQFNEQDGVHLTHERCAPATFPSF